MGPVKSRKINYLFFYLKGAKEIDLKFSTPLTISDGQLSDSVKCRGQFPWEKRKPWKNTLEKLSSVP